MKQISFPLVADTLFYTVAAWLLSLGILRYFRVGFPVALAVSLLVALAVGVAVCLLLFHGRRKKLLGKREREARDKLMLHFALEKEERVRAAFLEAYAKDGKDAHCRDDGIEAGELFLIPRFTMEPLSADAVARILRDHQDATVSLACNALTPEAERLLLSFGGNAICANEVYALFARADAMPDPMICGKIPRKSVKGNLRRAFSKRNARPFFVSGCLLLLMSLFTFFPLYYVISGGILLVSAVFVRAIGYA